MYQIQTDKFSGPLDVLLGLVEKRNLEITEISLSEVTQDYLVYINKQENVSPYHLAEFLVVASTLLLIKSKAILPSLILGKEEQEEIIDLEEHLYWYKLFKEQGKYLQSDFQKNIYCFTRSPWKDVSIHFNAPKNVTLSYLSTKLGNFLAETDKEAEHQKKVIKKVINLQDRIKLLLNKLTKGSDYQFSQLVGKTNKEDIIVTFLAILHLLRGRVIRVKQNKNFGEIWISNQK